MFLCYLLSNCVYPKSIQIQYWSCSVSSSNINNFLAPRPLCLPCWPLLYFMIIILSTDRVSHKWVSTLFWLFSRLPEFLQRSILPFFNSPGDDNSKTHLTFLPMSKIDQVTEQNVRQTGFRYYYFGTYKVYLNCI